MSTSSTDAGMISVSLFRFLAVLFAFLFTANLFVMYKLMIRRQEAWSTNNHELVEEDQFRLNLLTTEPLSKEYFPVDFDQLSTNCSLSDFKHIKYALKRVKTEECKIKITKLGCLLAEYRLKSGKSPSRYLHPTKFIRKCPLSSEQR